MLITSSDIDAGFDPNAVDRDLLYVERYVATTVGHFKKQKSNCPGTLGDVNPLRNKGLRFPPRRKLASKRVQNTTLGAIAQKNTSIYQWVGVPGQLLLLFQTIAIGLTAIAMASASA